MDSILNSVKKVVQIPEDITNFDEELIIHINSILAVMAQMGIGTEGYMISSSDDLWSDFLTDEAMYQPAKTYLALRVKTVFDPPQSSFVLEAYNKMIEELGVRLNLTYESEGDL